MGMQKPTDPDTEMTEEQKKQEQDKRTPTPRAIPGASDPRIRMTKDDRIKIPR